jgi:hypothetical protein
MRDSYPVSSDNGKADFEPTCTIRSEPIHVHVVVSGNATYNNASVPEATAIHAVVKAVRLTVAIP